MGDFDFDLFCIGAGSGGTRASRMAGAYGAKVAVAEARYFGGTCVNVGCIPKKLLVYGARVADELVDARGFGWSIERSAHDWRALIRAKDREVERLNGVYRKLLRDAGVQIFDGRARLVDHQVVEVGDRRYRARHVLVATGGWPFVPQIPGGEHAITSNEVFYLEERPARIVIVGGGYIALEFAGIFHALGSQVTLVHRGEQVLRGFDQDVRDTVAEEMRKRGIDVRVLSTVVEIDRNGGELGAVLADTARVDADQVMFATGRTPNTRGLGLEELGVRLGREGEIVVDAYSKSSRDWLYAVGDCTDRMALTPVAIAEGQALAETLFHDNPTRPDHSDVPSAVFSQPNVGAVGLTEEEARARYGEVDVYRSRFRPLRHTLSGRDERALVKLVVERASQRVLGCHMVGEEAGEIIQGLAVALKCGATKRDFDRTIGVHPTAAEEFVTMR